MDMDQLFGKNLKNKGANLEPKYDLRPWAVLAMVALFLFCGSTPIFGHGKQGHKDKATRNQKAPRKGTGGARWGANYFPNVPLITHEGKTVRFFDDLIKDKVVVINFIYTSCSESCPLETARLVNLQQLLGDRVGHDVFMYSITIDPKKDTPEVLKQYRAKYNVGPGWLFLTGKEEEIVLIRKKLGLYIEDIQDESSNDHNISIIIGNQSTGRWVKRSPFENPYFLAAQVGSWLHNWKQRPVNIKSYADAPDIRNMSTGENLYRRRCSACHTIGGGDIKDVARGKLGPDLMGVTRKRERAWLARWLANPEKMLAEKDPIAMALYTQYNNMLMPNFELGESDIAALIDYMGAESRRIEKTQRTAAPPK